MKTAEEILEERKNTHGDFEKGAHYIDAANYFTLAGGRENE